MSFPLQVDMDNFIGTDRDLPECPDCGSKMWIAWALNYGLDITFRGEDSYIRVTLDETVAVPFNANEMESAIMICGADFRTEDSNQDCIDECDHCGAVFSF